MHTDICNCQVSLTDGAAVAEWNGMILGFLSHSKTVPGYLKRLIELSPDYAMAYAAKGLFAMMMGKKELIASAQEAHQTAQAALARGGATKREQSWCAALECWVQGRPLQAVQCIEAAMRDNPADTMSMKVSHAIRFMMGDNHGLRRSVERVMDAHGEDHALRGYALGCLSFAQEETGDYELSERSGLEALQFAPDDAWGMHSVAHVYDMTHQTKAGIDLIENNTSAWGHCNNFRYHVWWHKALLLLDHGSYDQVLGLYDTQIREEKTDDYRDFSNASSLLLRLELEGVDVGDRWAELADLAESRSGDGCLVFADLHYMLALAGDNRPDAAARLTARVAQTASEDGDQAQVMKDPGLAAAEGLAAFGEGQYDVAFAKLRAAQPKFQIMGGSHAQRDVFERVTIDAGIRAGRLDETAALVAQRTKLRKGAVDAFAEARMRMISDARDLKAGVAAE
ncbi:MAG: tetratricopeptide repeat protein [Pseudomonadota bacterium]